MVVTTEEDETVSSKNEMTSVSMAITGSTREMSSGTKSNSLRTNPENPLALGKRIVWRDIYAEVPVQARSCLRAFLTAKKKHDYRLVLNQVSGVAMPGELTFIMGASGAGKTTLLNILTQRNVRGLQIYGDVFVNKHPIDAANLRKISAYVQQEDSFIAELTVQETIVFAANLKMGKKYSDLEKENRVDEVILSMGLTNCKQTRIGGRHQKKISRGEKKRLAFACEVLTDPPILFCDEPTSGLDAFMAKQVIVAMKKLAEDGKTVISTIHQPSSQVYEMADSLILMANGSTAYHGRANEVIDFFTSAGFPMEGAYMNPSDHFLQVMAITETETDEEHRKRVEKITEHFEKSTYGEIVRGYTHQQQSSNTEKRRMKEDYSMLSQYKISWYCQTWLLFCRSLRCLIRNPMVFYIRLAQVLVCSTVIGALFLQTELQYKTIQNYMGVLYNNVKDMNFMFVFPCISVFTTDMPIVIREYKSSMYYPSAYFLGKNLADTIQYFVFPFIYSLIIFLMAFNISDMILLTGNRWTPLWKFLRYALTNISIATCATSVGYAAACVFGSLEIAVQILPLIVVPLLAVGGLFINLRSIPPYFSWIEHISYYRFGFEAHMNNLFNDVEHIPGCENKTNEAYCHQEIPKGLENEAPKNGSEGQLLLFFMKLTDHSYWGDIGLLMVVTVILRLVALIALHIRVARR